MQARQSRSGELDQRGRWTRPADSAGCRRRAPWPSSAWTSSVDRPFGQVDELGREQFVHRRHVDAVEARRDDRRAGDADVDLPAPPRFADPCNSTCIVVERTIVSSTSSTRLPSRTSRQRRVLGFGLASAVGAAFDERPAAVAVAHQPFDARGSPSAKAIASAAALLVSGTGTTIVSSSMRHGLQPGQLLAQRVRER